MFSGEQGSSGAAAGGAGLGYSRGSGFWKGGASTGAEWERGANLKEYYTKREEQEAQAVWVQLEGRLPKSVLP